ncbi:hypothetical protein STA3757_33880 [Stanieria sp. NIES-3757]|nr:hypothetical protein STA3757_33880 [Stanieria sp. NIES-3757]
MRITLVAKIGLDGKICPKSAFILKKLQNSGLLAQIDRIIFADERDIHSEGFALATQYQVENIPFFLIIYQDGTTKTYTTYSQLVNEFLSQKTLNTEEIEHNN